jgi:hypothetical protein
LSSREDPSYPFSAERASSPDRANTPASEPTGPLFDALDAPLPSEIELAERDRRRAEREQGLGDGDAAVARAARLQPRPAPRPRPERTDVVPRREWRPQEERRTNRPIRPRPGGVRRVRRTIKHIDPLSVLKISAFFYALFFLVWLMGAAVLYWFVQSLGWIDAVQTVSDVILGEDVKITLGLVERYAFMIGLAIVIIGSIANLLIAFLYNVASDLFGGINVTFSERDN